MPERALKRSARIQGTEVFRDYTLIFVVLFLLALGLVMLYSTSSYEAALQFGDSAHYLKKQLFSTVIGLLVMLLVSVLPYRLWGRLATPAFFLAVALILAIIPFGVESGGAKRWLYFFGVSFQPAEAAKLTTIVVAAAMIEKLGSLVKTLKGMFLVFLPPAILSFMLYKITRNLSSA
ncbi:MAG: FtsW/RodA/SpoVE family cell cycle protein, partial [Lachnospiraceae bacterium]|nr:FtsW/RodA/SpoVE family cell cycle protein [Lachnospiraceae bacterium]